MSTRRSFLAKSAHVCVGENTRGLIFGQILDGHRCGNLAP